MRIVDLLSSRDLSKVARLQWLARGVVEGYCSGKHRSPHKGFSVEFKEHRPYVRGDELKSIDWKAFGKSDRLFVRLYEEETNLRCNLLVDRSGSMLYGGTRAMRDEPAKNGGNGKPITKFQYTQRLAAAMTYMMLGQQDAVGAVTFDSKITEQVPCKSKPSHLRALMSAIAAEGRHGETDLGGVLTSAAARIGRRSLVVIISDAMGDIESLNRALTMIRSRNNEVIFFQINDPDELDFPFDGRIQFRDLENASPEQTVDAAVIRDQYLEGLANHQKQLSEVCRKNRVDLVSLTTADPIGDALGLYVTRRARASRRS
jgi:uncharacterized protein (DUF58 family)